MVKIILHTTIITLLYLSYRTLTTPEFTFNFSLCVLFIWLLKLHSED